MSEEALLQIYYFMRLTRAMEDRTRTLFLQGKVVGGVYTAQGHEAATVGAASMLKDGDCIVPQHRDLGMHLVRGTSPRAVMSQWLARGNSPSLGRDNALHKYFNPPDHLQSFYSNTSNPYALYFITETANNPAC